MSGAPRVRSMNVDDSDPKSISPRKPISKPSIKVEKSTRLVEEQERWKVSSLPRSDSIKNGFSRSNMSLNASCSSDASTDSFRSRSSTGRISRSISLSSRRKPKLVSELVVSECPKELFQLKRRCTWVTPNTDPLYVAFHDEEWGVPVHDDKKLFELLVFSGALSELTWPTILSKRHIFREVFADFDPIVVSKLNEKKLVAQGSTGSSLLSEPKLRAIVENARQISKVIEEVGSFDRYIWGFMNYNPAVGKFRYSRQVPVKTSKADFISKDLVRRGFRSVGPTVVYSFMQVSGLTNDHLVSCFRFEPCVEQMQGKECCEVKVEDERIDLTRAVGELSFSSG